MDNLNDIYYLVRLIVRQIFIYLRDFFLRDSPWLTVTGGDFQAGIVKQNSSDFFAVSLVCVLFFLLLILSSVCAKDEEPDYVSTNMETTCMDLPEDHSYLSGSGSSSSFTGDPGSGDFIGSSRRRPRTESVRFTKSFSKNSSVSKRVLADSSDEQSQHSQSTQTSEQILRRVSEEWLIRRTRSGHVYGKYPL